MRIEIPFAHRQELLIMVDENQKKPKFPILFLIENRTVNFSLIKVKNIIETISRVLRHPEHNYSGANLSAKNFSTKIFGI